MVGSGRELLNAHFCPWHRACRGGSNSAHALTITAAWCNVQPNNSQRWDCTVTTDTAADVWIKFGPDTTGVCDGLRVTPTSTNGTTHYLTMYGMKPSTTYDWKAHARPAAGGPLVTFACRQSLTDVVPPDAGLDQITVTKTGTAQQVKAVLTHYGCYDPVLPEVPRDALTIFDKDGNLVWYQDVATDLGFDPGLEFQLEAISLSRPQQTILAVANHEILVEYDLAGNLLTALCYDDASGYCPGTSFTPDGFFDNYIHHDVQRRGDLIHVLNARDVMVTDVLDCDADASTTDQYPIIVDGLYTFDTSGVFPVIVTDFMLTDAAGVTIDYTTHSCGSPGYWNPRLDGKDAMHTNAFWIDVADQWMFSLKSPSQVWSVDRDLGSGTVNQIIWEAHGSLATGDFSDTAGGLDETFSDQHTVHWGPNGEFMLFDNGPGGGVKSKGMTYTMDVGLMTLDALAEYTVEDSSGATKACSAGGSAFLALGGNAVVTCPANGGPDSPASINEFDATNNVVWALDMECNPASYLPAGIAFRGYANPW